VIDVVARLQRAGCVAAEEEAVALRAAATDDVALEAAVRRREGGEPLAWITGTARFCGHDVRVTRGVYVPRPQTEVLARRAAALLATSTSTPRRAVDLCTGSGAIAHHLAQTVPDATVVGVDIDDDAVACARANGVLAVRGALGTALRNSAFDVVTAVAPYVPTGQLHLLPADVQWHEPRRALDGGDDGLDVVRAVVEDAARLLRPGGWLLIEVGGDQDAALRDTCTAHGFDALDAWRDDEGDLRGIAVRR